MIMLFFAGLIIMASAGSISEISNITYLQLVCNVVGGIMMGGSAFFFFKEESRKKKELKVLVEKLPGKEEQENEINVLNAIEKVLQGYRENLKVIDENQEKIIASVCDNSEIKDFMTASTQNLRDTVENIEKAIKDENFKLYSAVDVLHIDYTEFRRQEDHNFAMVIENTTNVVQKLEIQANHLEESKNEIMEILIRIEQSVNDFNSLPGKISESIETLMNTFEKSVDRIQMGYQYLAEDIKDEEKDRTKKFHSIMTEIRDSTEESNEEMTEEIKKLAEQYESFEKLISAIVNQMSLMAEEDINVMKGFLNG